MSGTAVAWSSSSLQLVWGIPPLQQLPFSAVILSRSSPAFAELAFEALGIAYSGAAPTVEMPTFNVLQGGFGLGGSGGDANAKTNNGSNGQTAQTLEF